MNTTDRTEQRTRVGGPELELGRYSNRYFAPESLLFPMKDKEHFPVLSFLFGYFGRLLTRASSSPLLSCVRAPPPRDFTQSHVSHGGTLDTPMGRDDRSSLEVICCSSPLTSAFAVAKLGRVSFLPEIYLSIYRPPDPLCHKRKAPRATIAESSFERQAAVHAFRGVPRGRAAVAHGTRRRP